MDTGRAFAAWWGDAGDGVWGGGEEGALEASDPHNGGAGSLTEAAPGHSDPLASIDGACVGLNFGNGHVGGETPYLGDQGVALALNIDDYIVGAGWQGRR